MVTLEKRYLHGYYLIQLPLEKQKEIITELEKAIDKLFLTDVEKIEALENAKCEKVCNLIETINFIWI